MGKDPRREISTARLMLEIFCRGRHGGAGSLCPDCAELLDYSTRRLKNCPHDPKPPCRDCRTHCYSPAMREKMREAMRYSGPRIALRRPLAFLKHYLAGLGGGK